MNINSINPIDEIFFQSIFELYLFKKIIKPKDDGGIYQEDTQSDILRKCFPLLKFWENKKNEDDDSLEINFLRYLEDSTFNCEHEVIPEIVNNEELYRELCYNKNKPKQKREGEKKNEEKSHNNTNERNIIFSKSVSFVKLFYYYVKENAKKSSINTLNTIKNIPRNHKFFDTMKSISEKLLNKLYTSENLNYEAENKICLLLYIMKNTFMNYCFFFNNIDLENYIKEFKKFKK